MTYHGGLVVMNMSEVNPIARWMINGITPLEVKIQEELSFLGDKFITYNGRTVKDIFETRRRYDTSFSADTGIVDSKEYYLYMQRHPSGDFKTFIMRPETGECDIQSLVVNVEEPADAIKDAFYTEIIIFEL